MKDTLEPTNLLAEALLDLEIYRLRYRVCSPKYQWDKWVRS